MLTKLKYILKSFKKVDISNKPIPCMSCGACCAYFKVQFDKKYNPQVPWQKIKVISHSEAVMLGTEEAKGRCKSLDGIVGENCRCNIYNSRPDVCESFTVWLNDGSQNPKCIEARKHHGLKPEIDA